MASDSSEKALALADMGAQGHGLKVHMRVSENLGHLLGVLLIRESYYLGSILGVPYSRELPNIPVRLKELQEEATTSFSWRCPAHNPVTTARTHP